MAEDIEAVAKDIVDAAFKVHYAFEPGLLESVYQQCHAHELRKRGRNVLTEVVVPIVYDGQHIDAGYRLDMLIDDLVIVENKTIESVLAHTCSTTDYISQAQKL